MKCVICKHGNTAPGHTTIVFERDGSTLLIKDVPAEICENCGEYFVDEGTTEALLERAEEAIRANAVLQVINFAA